MTETNQQVCKRCGNFIELESNEIICHGCQVRKNRRSPITVLILTASLLTTITLITTELTFQVVANQIGVGIIQVLLFLKAPELTLKHKSFGALRSDFLRHRWSDIFFLVSFCISIVARVYIFLDPDQDVIIVVLIPLGIWLQLACLSLWSPAAYYSAVYCFVLTSATIAVQLVMFGIQNTIGITTPTIPDPSRIILVNGSYGFGDFFVIFQFIVFFYHARVSSP